MQSIHELFIYTFYCVIQYLCIIIHRDTTYLIQIIKRKHYLGHFP